jgi:hypothetical protein
VGTRPLVPAARHRVRDHVEGAALVHPFEMDTVVSLFGGRLVATHYGLYNTVSGIVITCGNVRPARCGTPPPANSGSCGWRCVRWAPLP